MNHQPRVWPLQEAKAKFSELVRLVESDGPQIVTVHGRPVVQVISVEQDKAKIDPTLTGADFVKALSAGPPLDFELPSRSIDTSGRDFIFE
jgi:prevent-host-death family protein